MRPKKTATGRYRTAQMLRVEERRGHSIETLIRTGHERGWTQQQIADDLGVSRETLNGWMQKLGMRYRIEFDSELSVG